MLHWLPSGIIASRWHHFSHLSSTCCFIGKLLLVSIERAA